MSKILGFDEAGRKTPTIDAFAMSSGLRARVAARVRADRMTLMLQLVAVPALVLALYAGQAAAICANTTPMADTTIEASPPAVC